MLRPAQDHGAVPIGTLVIALALAGGLLVGSVLGFTGALDLFGESDAVAASSAAPYYECPGDNTVAGWLHRGDRVLATGRTAEPSFVQVRSPRSSEARVWIAVEYLEPDADLGALPVLPCAVVVEVTVETTIPGDTTTTTVGGTTTTVVDTTTTSSTTTMPPPSVGPVSEQRDPIWESYLGADDCLGESGHFSTSVIAASITAPAGVQSVTMSWSVGGQTGSKSMTLSAGQYRATLGPFPAEPELSAVPQDQSLPITVTVRVEDSLGRTATRQTTVTLNDCTFI